MLEFDLVDVDDGLAVDADDAPEYKRNYPDHGYCEGTPDSVSRPGLLCECGNNCISDADDHGPEHALHLLVEVIGDLCELFYLGNINVSKLGHVYSEDELESKYEDQVERNECADLIQHVERSVEGESERSKSSIEEGYCNSHSAPEVEQESAVSSYINTEECILLELAVGVITGDFAHGVDQSVEEQEERSSAPSRSIR